MFEDNVAMVATHDPAVALDQGDGSMPMHAAENSTPNSPAPGSVDGSAKDRLQEINQLIHVMRDKLAVSQQQLEAKDAEINDLKEENDLILLQLHQVQEELETIFLDREEKKAELSWYRDQLTHWTKMVKSYADLLQKAMTVAGRAIPASPIRQNRGHRKKRNLLMGQWRPWKAVRRS